MENINNKDYGLVYVVYNSELNITKIGKTRNIKQRLIALSAASGCELTVIYTTNPLLDYSRIEIETHKKFKDKRRFYGEWFNIEAMSAVMFISKIVNDEKEHPISKMYREGIGTSELAIKYSVSRVYIINLLKSWGVYQEKKTISLLKIPKKDKIKNKSKIVENDLIPNEYRNSINFIRISANLYKHKVDNVYKTKLFVNGKIKEAFFVEKSEAIASLKN